MSLQMYLKHRNAVNSYPLQLLLNMICGLIQNNVNWYTMVSTAQPRLRHHAEHGCCTTTRAQLFSILGLLLHMCVVQLSSLFSQKRIPDILDSKFSVLYLSDSEKCNKWYKYSNRHSFNLRRCITSYHLKSHRMHSYHV